MTKCNVCPRECVLADGQRGHCKARVARKGRIRCDAYGQVASMSVGPVEEKPLLHFLPGATVLSVGCYGCNLSCVYCQNSEISQSIPLTRNISAAETIRIAKSRNVSCIAFTYSEPITWNEYVLNTGRLAKKSGLAVIIKTNGYANGEIFSELCDVADAINMDIKGSQNSYNTFCNIKLSDKAWDWPIFKNLAMASKKCHVEVSYPVVSRDTNEDGDLFWAISRHAGSQVPVHLIRIVPGEADWDQMHEIADIASGYLSNVYVTRPGGFSMVRCLSCGVPVVKRIGFTIISTRLLADGTCNVCKDFSGVKNHEIRL